MAFVHRVLTSWSIPNKLLLLLLVTFLPVSGIIIASGLSHRSYALREAENRAMLLVESLAAQQEQICIGTRQMLSTLAQMPEVRRLDAEECNKLFREIRDENPSYANILAISPDGNVFAASAPFEVGGLNLSDRKHVRDAMRTLDFSVGEYMVGRLTQVPSISYAFPVLDARRNLSAVVIASFRLNEFTSFIQKANLPDDSSVLIADHAGVRLFRWPESWSAMVGEPIAEETFKRMSESTGQGAFEGLGVDGIYRFYAFKRLHLWGGAAPYLYVGVGIPEAKTFGEANLEMLTNLAILGIVALVAMCLAWVLGHVLFVRPINQLVGATKRFGKGETGVRTGLQYTDDELGQLAESFDGMVALLEERENEQREAERALRNSTAQLRQIIDLVPHRIFVKDWEGKYLLANQTVADAYNTSVSAVTGKSHADFHPDGSELRQMLHDDREVMTTGQTKFIPEETYTDAHGNIRFLQTTKVPFNIFGNDTRAVLGIAIDITAQRHAAQSLVESETRFRTLFEAMTEGVALHEIVYAARLPVDYRILSVNPAYEAHMGLKPEQVLGQLASKIYGADKPPYLEKYAQVANSGKPLTFETYLPSMKRFFHISASSPKRGHFVTVFENITERKQAEARLRESEEKYRMFVETASEGIWAVDAGHRITFVNQVMCDMLGYGMDEIIGQPISAFVSKDQLEDHYAKMQSRESGSSEKYERKFIRKNGDALWVIVSAKSVMNEDGRFQGAFSTLTDITERKWAEQERERLESKLRQAQKLEAIGTLAGGIAHDFNNILSPMMGYTEMALSSIPEFSPMRYGLEQVLSASLRAKELVKQILAFGRIGKEQQQVPVEISSIVKEALKLLRASLPSSIEIRRHVEPCVANADPTQIHQLLMNLCTNAAHAMDGKGVLDIRLCRVNLSESDLADQQIVDLKPGPHLKLCVSDTGCGIDSATLERIFDPYFTTKEVGKGTGLGLAVVHGIVKRHDGAVSVWSEVGKGTTFSIYIPAIEVRVRDVENAGPVLPTGTERVLLIDDEQGIVRMGTAILEKLGYKVTPETNSLHALATIRSGPGEFDLVVTDYTMPKLSGTDLSNEIRKIRPDIPIILCTGFSEKITWETAKSLGLELIMKPFGIAQLAELVRKVLDAR